MNIIKAIGVIGVIPLIVGIGLVSRGIILGFLLIIIVVTVMIYAKSRTDPDFFKED